MTRFSNNNSSNNGPGGSSSRNGRTVSAWDNSADARSFEYGQSLAAFGRIATQNPFQAPGISDGQILTREPSSPTTIELENMYSMYAVNSRRGSRSSSIFSWPRGNAGMPAKDDIEARATMASPAPAACASSEVTVVATATSSAPTLGATASKPAAPKYPHLKRIFYAEIICGVVGVTVSSVTVISILVGGSFGAWVHQEKNMPAVVFTLTFGIYWITVLHGFVGPHIMFARKPTLEEKKTATVLGLKRKEWKAVMQILFPLFLALAAMMVYPRLGKLLLAGAADMEKVV